jgi:hypothetical protein
LSIRTKLPDFPLLRVWTRRKSPSRTLRRGQAAEIAVIRSLSEDGVTRALNTCERLYGEDSVGPLRTLLQEIRDGIQPMAGEHLDRLLAVAPLYAGIAERYWLLRELNRLDSRDPARNRLSITCDSLRSLEAICRELRTVVEVLWQQPVLTEDASARAWCRAGDSILLARVIAMNERFVLESKVRDFEVTLRVLHDFRRSIPRSVRLIAVFETAASAVAVNVVHPKDQLMPSDHPGPEEQRLVAQWSEEALESRFRAGEVSYPEYVLRNMDLFFTKEEQAELHKVAAMQGMELERALMEIQIKSRTSEADLEKLVKTLKTLQQRGINADIVSRHETASGHIEISAKSRRLGCLPFGSVLLAVGIVVLLLLL